MQACEPQAASNSRCLYCPAARLPSLQDYYQLLSPTVSVMDHTSVYTELYRLQNFKNEQQLPDPKLWIDIKALMGDPSDNIPGIKVGAWGVCVCGQPIHVYKGFMLLVLLCCTPCCILMLVQQAVQSDLGVGCPHVLTTLRHAWRIHVRHKLTHAETPIYIL
jgi:hypothetical protein